MPDPLYPASDRWWVKSLRFANLLDDVDNKLSPVKVNLWSANLTAVSAGAATVLAWLGGHMHLVADLWGPVGTWLVQAHATHHFDKRERNVASARLRKES